MNWKKIESNCMLEKKIFSVEDMEEFAEEVGKLAEVGDFFAVFGLMGAGKTTFTRGFARGVGIFDGVCSPTFAIINEYCGKIPIVHCDMYRILSEDDFLSTGFLEYLNGKNIVVVEWIENVLKFLPSFSFVKIDIEIKGTNVRNVKISRGCL